MVGTSLCMNSRQLEETLESTQTGERHHTKRRHVVRLVNHPLPDRAYHI